MPRRLKLSAGIAMAGTVMGAVLVLMAGTASAATVNYHTGPATGPNVPVSYSCNFPAIGQQQLDVSASFDGPSTVASGATATPSNVLGTATISATIHALLNAAGYDGVQGKANVPITATNATPASATVSNLNVPIQIFSPYVAGPLTINIAQDSGTTVPTLTAGTPGSASVSIGTTLTAPLQFHKASGSWTPWTFNCTVKTSPVQNRLFTPSITVT